jgi:hypothetical protein
VTLLGEEVLLELDLGRDLVVPDQALEVGVIVAASLVVLVVLSTEQAAAVTIAALLVRSLGLLVKEAGGAQPLGLPLLAVALILGSGFEEAEGVGGGSRGRGRGPGRRVRQFAIVLVFRVGPDPLELAFADR